MAASTKTALRFNREGFSDKELLDIYRAVMVPRLIEKKMLILLRQGKISKWFSGYGQEGISVGLTYCMEPSEYILPMHRNLGVFTTREIPLHRLFAQFQGKPMGFTNGRDRSFHFGTQDYHIVGMISHLGPQLGIADGIGLANKLRKEQKSTMVFTGDGGASEGDFHESLNVASVWELPVLFVIENNQWGLSTPSSEQFRCKQFIDKGIGYGMEAVQVDGNNILEVIRTGRELHEKIRKDGKPRMLECMTFRMRGHEEASGTKYYPEGLQDEWAPMDPVDGYQEFLLEQGLITTQQVEELENGIKELINSELEVAYAAEDVTPDVSVELEDMYAPHSPELVEPSGNEQELRFVDAVSQGLAQSMEKFPELVVMGQDIAEYGGVFKVTEGFVERFGKERVRNTPLCESAIVGASLGLSISGMKAVMEMQFADFVTCGFNQIVNNLAKIHWRWGQNADVVVRMPTGAGVAAGPFHSQSNEAWFFHTPGLKVVYPSTAYDAKGLLAASIEDPNPVMFFEHKFLYRTQKDMVPEEYYTLPLGKAKVVREGSDVTVISYGAAVHWAMEEADNCAEYSIEVIDLRTLLPLDEETIMNSVKKTGRVVLLHEDTLTGGIGAEISARITETCFEYLDAPVKRVASLDTPVPFNAALEQQFLPKELLSRALQEVVDY